MGFSVPKAQCLIAAAVVMFIRAVYSHKWHVRGLFLLEMLRPGLSSLGMLVYLEGLAPRYLGLFQLLLLVNEPLCCVVVMT